MPLKERFAFFKTNYIRFFLYLKEKTLEKEAENLAGLSLVKKRNKGACDSPAKAGIAEPRRRSVKCKL